MKLYFHNTNKQNITIYRDIVFLGKIHYVKATIDKKEFYQFSAVNPNSALIPESIYYGIKNQTYTSITELLFKLKNVMFLCGSA
jgi:hypothetical protein